MDSITPARLYEDQKEELHLELLGSSLASRREITVSDINRPGMALMGFVENFLPERIQILAQTELAYLATLSEPALREAVDRVFAFSMPLVVVCKGLEPPPYLLQRAEECQVPVMRTSQSTTPFLHLLSSYLDHMLAASTTVHASLVDVYGCGLLITGRSGIGKSETALDLIDRGHRLVADDVVEIKRMGDVLVGVSPDLTRFHMELRGLGVLNIKDLYGVSAMRLSKRVELVIQLERWEAGKEYDRLGLRDETFLILGV